MSDEEWKWDEDEVDPNILDVLPFMVVFLLMLAACLVIWAVMFPFWLLRELWRLLKHWSRP